MTSNMNKSLHDEDENIRDLFRKEGIKGAHEYIQEKMHTFTIAVTGLSGTGKSSFVNAIRSVSADDPMAARVGVVETTQKVEIYSHPDNNNLLIYDLPGIGGSLRFSQENYFDEVQFSKFDFYIIVSSGRFTELDVVLATKVQELGKKYYFVRSKIDIDLMNMKRSNPKTYNETEVTDTIRRDCFSRLGGTHVDSDVFLIDNHENNEYDFPRLRGKIVHDAPLIKVDMRERAASFLVNEFYGKIKKNAKIEAGPTAMKSALEGKIKIPLTSIYIESNCICEQIENYKRVFSLTEQSVLEYANLMHMSLEDMTENLSLRSLQMNFTESEIVKACTEVYPASKSSLPLIGSFLGSRSVVKAYLENIIDQMAEDAIKLNIALISRKRNQISDSISSCV